MYSIIWICFDIYVLYKIIKEKFTNILNDEKQYLTSAEKKIYSDYRIEPRLFGCIPYKGLEEKFYTVLIKENKAIIYDDIEGEFAIADFVGNDKLNYTVTYGALAVALRRLFDLKDLFNK